MALNRNIYDLGTVLKTSIDNNDYIETSNSLTKRSSKLLASSIFPSLSTTGTGSENFYIDITNKNQLNFKGIKSGDAGLLTVSTASNNIVITPLESGIDLSLCNNTNSLFNSGVDFTATVTGENSVINGGTGLSTIAKGAILYASETDTIKATPALTNGQLFIGNATTGIPSLATLTGGDNVTISNTAGSISIAASLATMSAVLDMANYGIDLGTGWLSGNGTAEGININSDGKVFVGEDTPTAAFVDTLNIKGGIRFTNNSAPTIKPTATTGSNVGMAVTIESGGSASGAAGNLNLTAGTASGDAAGGTVNITAGRDTSGSSDGYVCLKTYTGGTATAGLTVSSEGQNVTVDTGNLVITQASKGIIHSGSGTVTQATDHTTGVTMNTTSGVIQLAAVALAAATNAEFTVTNSTVQADSVILITMQDENTVNNAQLSCAIHTVVGGSFKVSIFNAAATGATSTTASKIHFLVINNS
jgi:hypothetical protein|tara:strand:- start:958 stop:2385 length:1428 start_codon:yes stop_codon:yes gene_type:complete